MGSPILDEVGSFAALRGSARYAEVIGIVQNQSGTLVPNAGLIRIRSLHTGALAATTQVNELAQFSVRSLVPGLYVAELVGSAGSVLASTPAFSAGAGEVIQVAQTIPVVPVQGLARALRSATSATLSSAAAAGILAVAPGVSVTPGS
jgi:hypothetical protein